MWELNYKEDWALKNWCFQIVVLEKTLESPLDCKEIKPVNPKGNQSWIFIGRIDAEARILWPPDGRSWFIGKDADARKDWGQEEKRVTKDKTVGWHHQLEWTGVWATSQRQWWTGKPGVLQCMGSQRGGQTWATEQQQIARILAFSYLKLQFPQGNAERAK